MDVRSAIAGSSLVGKSAVGTCGPGQISSGRPRAMSMPLPSFHSAFGAGDPSSLPPAFGAADGPLPSPLRADSRGGSLRRGDDTSGAPRSSGTGTGTSRGSGYADETGPAVGGSGISGGAAVAMPMASAPAPNLDPLPLDKFGISLDGSAYICSAGAKRARTRSVNGAAYRTGGSESLLRLGGFAPGGATSSFGGGTASLAARLGVLEDDSYDPREAAQSGERALVPPPSAAHAENSFHSSALRASMATPQANAALFPGPTKSDFSNLWDPAAAFESVLAEPVADPLPPHSGPALPSHQSNLSLGISAAGLHGGPSAVPATSLPLGGLPAGSLPLGSLPAGSLPLGSLPPGPLPPGSLPLGSLPPGPAGGLSPSAIPPGSFVTGTLTAGALPGPSSATGPARVKQELSTAGGRIAKRAPARASAGEQCGECGLVLRTRAILLNHMRVVHKSSSEHRCPECDAEFPWKSTLGNHIRLVHRKERPYSCRLCDKAFRWSSHLEEHVWVTHEKRKPFKCPVCSKDFGRKNNMQKHIRKVHQANPTNAAAAAAAALPKTR